MDNLTIQNLTAYIRSHPSLLRRDPAENTAGYEHMGAILTDAMLQAGLRYKTTVLPRVKKVEAIPEAATTSGFLILLEREGAPALLDWSDSAKPHRLVEITRFFIAEMVETVVDLRAWLSIERNTPRLKMQPGVGDKTADYFKILAGIDSVAIDRHLYQFLDDAGCPAKNYDEAQAMIRAAADHLKLPYSVLDHNIWLFQSRK